MSQHGEPFDVSPQFLDKCCCPVCSVWIHEDGKESRFTHTAIAFCCGWLYTLFCWPAIKYRKTFVETAWANKGYTDKWFYSVNYEIFYIFITQIIHLIYFYSINTIFNNASYSWSRFNIKTLRTMKGRFSSKLQLLPGRKKREILIISLKI